MAWPKGVPRKRQNIDKESAVNPFEPQEPAMQAQPQGDTAPPQSDAITQKPDAPPNFVENKPVFRPFHDRDSLEEKYAKHLGLDTLGEQKMETAEDKQETPPAEADTGVVKTETSETIEVKKDEPVTATESTTVTQPEATPVTAPIEEKVFKHKTIEEAEKAAKEAERKMHEATQERARIEAEKKSLETLNKQMLEVLQTIKTSQVPPAETQPKDELELTPEQKTELIINDPDKYERLVIEKAKREIRGEFETKQKADQEAIAKASQQRGLELFLRMGDQHFVTTYPEMQIFGPYVKEAAEKILRSPGAKELISQKGPQGLIDQAVEDTKIRIEQIKTDLTAGATPPPQNAAPANTGEVRTPIPASPVVKPSGVIPAPVAPAVVIPTQEQITKDYAAEKNAWRQQRGLG